jgi:hypothetical protein
MRIVMGIFTYSQSLQCKLVQHARWHLVLYLLLLLPYISMITIHMCTHVHTSLIDVGNDSEFGMFVFPGRGETILLS